MHWQTSRRKLSLVRPLVMAILNVTPDSFSDGGRFTDVDDAMRNVEKMIGEGADIIDVGGESTRPGSLPVSPEGELSRVTPIVAAIASRFAIPISVDTTKSLVARAALDAGAEIVNDISGLRWDPQIASVAAEYGAGLVLMHSIGTFSTMHTAPHLEDVMSAISNDLHRSIGLAHSFGVGDEQIALDPGIGFGKSYAQNVEILAKLDNIADEFRNYPLMIGTSRKSFLRQMYNAPAIEDRIPASMATAETAVAKGAAILRVHDVAETVAMLNDELPTPKINDN